jgi:hypothetical protein
MPTIARRSAAAKESPPRERDSWHVQRRPHVSARRHQSPQARSGLCRCDHDRLRTQSPLARSPRQSKLVPTWLSPLSDQPAVESRANGSIVCPTQTVLAHGQGDTTRASVRVQSVLDAEAHDLVPTAPTAVAPRQAPTHPTARSWLGGYRCSTSPRRGDPQSSLAVLRVGRHVRINGWGPPKETCDG